MKHFVIFACLVTLAFSQFSSETAEKIKQVSKECIKSTGVDPDLIRRVREGDIVEEDKVKQFVSCVLKTLKLEDGSFDRSIVEARLPNGLTDSEKDSILGKCLSLEGNNAEDGGEKDSILGKCLSLEGNNAEDRAFKAYKCYRENAKVKSAI
ncbi:PBP/GOBP family [Popillia japonica]|uniref:PBP/GOBP family n=1 Tax=Popillia japonica TaxID=7064 RepID=A0AAW1L6X0_POPJA